LNSIEGLFLLADKVQLVQISYTRLLIGFPLRLVWFQDMSFELIELCLMSYHLISSLFYICFCHTSLCLSLGMFQKPELILPVIEVLFQGIVVFLYCFMYCFMVSI